MIDPEPLDREHLLLNARSLFPHVNVTLTYAPDEIIHIDVDGRRFSFEIGSDDDEYIFTDGTASFTIPLMDRE